MLTPDSGTQAALDAEARSTLPEWGLRPGQWRVTGAVAGAQGGLLRPVIEIEGASWLLRRQAPDLTESDTRFRHTFMRQLSDAGLPVPRLRPRPDGRTWALDDKGIVELQEYLPGAAYATDDPRARDWLAAAAETLGALHQASAEFDWQPFRWPEEHSAAGLALAYIQRIRAAAGSAPSERIRTGLERIADVSDARVAGAMNLLTPGQPGPPQLHIHGDYQPHNLAFGETRVSAIYDFDAARWEQRIYEVAYALFFFTGLRWDATSSLTPALVDDGLDILRVHSFLSAYGREAPPAEDEAELLASALTLVFPVVFANGVAEDIVFADDYEGALDEDDALARLAWADRFWLWLDRYAGILAQAWENA
ncbi:MAG TPA: phosphotransferase [Ktedonobacterales bacterium]|nr:phosphotransferase [Ktedonobacterales bacterium]